MKYQHYIVDKIIRESSTICSFYLKRAEGESLQDYKPGQFITVQVQPEGFTKPVFRNYTLSDRPGAGYYRITVKKEPGGMVSNFLHDHIVQGDLIKASPPAGDFYLDEGSTSPVVLLSGGVGITPMMSMLEHLLFKDTDRKIYFLHSSTNKEVQPMAPRLAEIRSNHSNVLVTINHSKPLSDEQPGFDYDVEGRITLDQLKQTISDPAGCTYYLCGPGPFMQAMYGYLTELGVAASAIYYEFFGNAIQLATSHKQNQAEEKSYEVKFSKTNKTLSWTGEHLSILELAESADIPVFSSCRMGSCLSCESRLMEGEVRYDPEPFMEAEESKVLICCAQPASNLVLDL